MDVVTGAFSFTGQHIARLLLEQGRDVKTLTAHPERAGVLEGRVPAEPLDFTRPRRLAESLRGADTLYNTYWIRFPHGGMTFQHALDNTQILLEAAAQAGVRRVVHLSVTACSEASAIPYFRFKALAEQAVRDTAPSWGIVRPTITFGTGDVLVNNLAWMLRRMPVFAVPGRGEFHVQPVHVQDVAEVAVAAGAEGEDVTWDAAGPETLTFNEFVRTVARGVHSRALIVHVPTPLALLASRGVGALVRDVVLIRDEVRAMEEGLLLSAVPPRGTRTLSGWLAEEGDRVGRRYVSDLRRHFSPGGSA